MIRYYTLPGPSDPEPLLAEAAFALMPLLVSLALASPFSSRSAWCQNSASWPSLLPCCSQSS
jgi:hypothetical protein